MNSAEMVTKVAFLHEEQLLSFAIQSSELIESETQRIRGAHAEQMAGTGF